MIQFLNKNGIKTDDATATENDILSPKTAYVNGEKIIGTMTNNKELNYTPSNSEQIIPEGYTSGGTILPAVMTQEEYDRCVNTGNIILGEELLPYTPVSFIQSTGTQYINMNYVPTNTTVIEIDFEKTGEIVDYERLFGVNDYFEIMRHNSTNQFEYKINRPTASAGFEHIFSPVNANERHKVKCGNTRFYFDDTLSKEYTDKFTTSKSMYLFYSNGGDRYGKFKIYSVKIWEGVTLKRAFIPCLDETGIACLYEKMENKFYYNKGSGLFTYGEVSG